MRARSWLRVLPTRFRLAMLARFQGMRRGVLGRLLQGLRGLSRVWSRATERRLRRAGLLVVPMEDSLVGDRDLGTARILGLQVGFRFRSLLVWHIGIGLAYPLVAILVAVRIDCCTEVMWAHHWQKLELMKRLHILGPSTFINSIISFSSSLGSKVGSDTRTELVTIRLQFWSGRKSLSLPSWLHFRSVFCCNEQYEQLYESRDMKCIDRSLDK